MAQTQAPPNPAQPPEASPFADTDFGPAAQSLLGGCYYRGGDPGKLLTIIAYIRPGDFESAFMAYQEAGLVA